MFNENIEKALDAIKNSDYGSPARKRTRLDSNIIKITDLSDHWSLQLNNVLLDEMVDAGVGKLPKCDSDISNTPVSDIDLMENINSLHDTILNFSNSVWDDFSVQKKDIESPHQINYFDDLSDEIILNIFHWLPKNSLNKIALVCQRFYRLSQDESLWAKMDFSRKCLQPAALGRILSRQVIILRLAQTEICDPIMSKNVRAAEPTFKARLMYLDLSMAHISQEALEVLFAKCRRLRKLSLENVCVNDEILKMLSYNKDLEVLNLTMTEGIQEKGLNYILTNCKKLKELNLAWTYLSATSIKFACKHFPPSLNRLNFSGCRKLLNDNSLLDLVKSCPNLRELDLSDCTGLTGEAIQHVILLENLNFLALSRCYFIPHNTLLLLKRMKSLMYLDVHGGYLGDNEMLLLQKGLEPNVTVNKFKFSSIARPTVGLKRTSIWGLRVRD